MNGNYDGAVVRNFERNRIGNFGDRRKILQRENHRNRRTALLYRRQRSEEGPNAPLP